MRRATRRHTARRAPCASGSSVNFLPRSYPSARSSSASQAASMKTSARFASTAALIGAIEGSSKTSQSSHTLVSRTRRTLLVSRTRLTLLVSQHHQLGRAASLDEHDRVLPERPPDAFRIRARDPDHQRAALGLPASLRIAPLALEAAVSRFRLRLDEGGVGDLVLPGARRHAARVGRGDIRRGRRALGCQQLVQVRIRLADADHELGLAEDDVQGLFVGGDQPGLGGTHPALLLAGELPACDEALEILRAADEHALHEHHGKSGPAGPHLEHEALSPLAQVAAVLEILVRETGGIERLPRLLRKWILAHADHDDAVRRHRRLDLLQDVGPVARDLLAHRGMDLRFGEDSAGHMEFLFVCGLPAAYARTAAPLSASAGRNQLAAFFLRV